MTVACILLALWLDARLGEPRRWHPLVGFGHLVSRVEQLLYRATTPPLAQQLAGAAGWLLLAGLPALVLWWLTTALPARFISSDPSSLWPWWLAAIDVVVLYLAIGNQSLAAHAQAVASPLLAGDLAAARRQVAMIVSRDTAALDAAGVTRASVESVLENGSDAVIAPLFWFALAGAPGVLLYRLANTLDARWGYRSAKYLHFGRAAARLDDVLNVLPARLCALGYGLSGGLANALRCWQRQAPLAASPNAGPVMAAGAGALGIRVGGAASYHGREEWRPILGCGRDATPADIPRALALLKRTTRFSVLLILVAELTLSVMTATGFWSHGALGAELWRLLPWG